MVVVVVSGRARLGPIERPPAEGASWTPQPFCVIRLQTSGPDGAVRVRPNRDGWRRVIRSDIEDPHHHDSL